MKGSVKIARLFGIDIEINASWLIIFFLVTFMLATSYFPDNYADWDPAVTWILAAIMALMLFVSVLLHELSHSIVSISQGIPVKKISLFIFGGLAQMDSEPDSPSKELKIALAGPAMSVFLSAVSWLLVYILDMAGAGEIILVPLTYIASVNLILAIFNMVPAFPLDGGRVIRAILWQLRGDLPAATKIASTMGSMFGYFLIFLGIFWVFSGVFISGIWFIFIGWFINQASQSSYQNTVMSDIFNKIHVRSFMTQNVIPVSYHIPIGDLVENYFYKYKFSSFPVMKHDQVIGLVTLSRVKELPRDRWDQTTTETITVALEENLIASPDETVANVMQKLFSNQTGRILVMQDQILLGIISKTDILNYIRIHSQLT